MMKKKILKFGKSFDDLDEIKKDFFVENDTLLEKANVIRKIYKSQPIRRKCKFV